ncbi:MAG: PolC-type DNA polymerase III [Vallitalea sp.]|jgi:DNA polymerase-3 subunit alpha (Gram-positive type)|nr:PolC-type DNA polymerase III [Vallitalea sp.]
MSKCFVDVFNDIYLNDNIAAYFNNAEVKKVVIDSRVKELQIYVVFKNIVHVRFIQQVEKLIKNNLCTNSDLDVKIISEFDVNYDLDKLLLLYQESILYELKQFSPICFGILKKANINTDNSNIIITLKNDVNSFLEDKKIDKKIENIINNRFKMNTKVSFELHEKVYENNQKFVKKREIQEKEFVTQIMNTKPIVTKNDTSSNEKQKSNKNIDNDKMIYGRKFSGEITPIDEIDNEIDTLIFDGIIISVESREIKNEKYIVAFDLTNDKDSITAKCFIKKEQFEEEVKNRLVKGKAVRVRGNLQFDSFSKEMTVMARAIMEINDFRIKRLDLSKEKRVELHAHTQMSDMDSVVSAKNLVNQAIEWGHDAIAITDHGVVQAFPEAFHAAHGKDIKIIYGVEAYLVDDLKSIVHNSKMQSLNDEYVIFDLETTGFYPGKDRITEIGAVKIKNGEIIDEFSSFVNPERYIPEKVVKLTNITNDMVADAPLYKDILPKFIDFVGDSIFVAHNADFDMSFIRYFCNELGIYVKNTVLDTLELGRILMTNLKNHKLNTIAKELGISLENHHRAVDDAMATAKIFIEFIHMLQNKNINNLEQLEKYSNEATKNVKKLKYYHAIILAKNLVGLRNLYELISKSHIDYFFRKPRIPKSVYLNYKEGLLIGSACEAGELYKAVLDNKPKEEIDKLVDFYDYLEIQPLMNNEFMIRNGRVKDKDELIDINKKIIALGEEHNKLVVGTCDVHFLNPEDEVYRRIIMAGQGFSDADDQPPLYFRTTEEMLREFSYLDDDKAREIVIDNTRRISDMIEKIEPVPPDKYPPVIEGSEQDLRNICVTKAKSIYGDPLPTIVKERLERELNSIISNGFAVMYIIAQKLVWKSNEDGYLVGSRGSVGSSFAATMAGITEVNPLSPHYICPSCKYSDFDSEIVKKNAGNSGCDLPDKKCPKCGADLEKEGHDIPFETFLGFKGNKEPDIDLNFSGEYQSKAHDYTEEIFGTGHVFRAGTIGTLAEKTAYGFVKKYFDEKGITVRNAEINRLIGGCTGARRTTGQHPGGIIVVPKSEEIYKFTPVQRPANDMKTKITTTHFDYHSIDHNLLKLDILGHDDPTMIRMLEDITGLDAKTIKFDEPKVASLFTSTEALGIKPDDIDGCPLGSLGIPEFGTDFVIQMLLDTKPTTFSELCKISVLSHGTDVWLNNAQELIRDGKATIGEVISSRDDIMVYLINMGVEKELSFTIMESVRKGKGLKPEWEDIMKENNVPDWYIWSCKQIKYMFPKAHAVAYVMMAYRIAYFKVYFAKAYYAAYFSIRASDFDYEIMCHGKDKVDNYINEYKSRINDLSKKEKDTLKDMKIVQEMYARGIDFIPIDLYKVKAKLFQVFDDGIMPSLSAIQGLGEKAADNIVLAREDGEFLSIDELRQRTKISKTVIEVMRKNNILDGMPESNQLSLF